MINQTRKEAVEEKSREQGRTYEIGKRAPTLQLVSFS
jgi:hypothetical protein